VKYAANPAIVERAAREQVPFTMACWSSTLPNRVPRQNRVKRMFEAGLNIVLGTDDPAMFATTMGHCWRTLFAASEWARHRGTTPKSRRHPGELAA
jgi:adenosine deaminase